MRGVVIGSLDGASPSATGGGLANSQGGEGGVDAGPRVGGSRSLPGWRHAMGPRFVSFLANRETAKQPNQRGRGAGGGRDVPATTQAGLLAGWRAVSKRGRQAVKVAKEQASKARRKLAGARPARTTTVGPPTGAPPGPVLAQATNNDGGDDKPGPKPDTAKDSATAEPPTNQ